MKTLSPWFYLLIACFPAWAGTRVSVGTPSSMLARLALEHTASSKAFAFPTPSSELIQVGVEDYYFQNGWLSMVGRAKESPNSDFILKGDNADMYGWLVLKDKKIAFEYTTDAYGSLVVEQVPVEKIFPVCDFENQDETFPTIPSELQKPGPEPHIGPYPAGLAPNKFQSKPGAPRVLYWNISDAPDVWTPEQMWEAWQTFSAGYSMYDVNVTTDPDVWAATPVPNRGAAHQVSTSGTSSCGVAAFGTSRACNIFKKSSPAYQGGTLMHETGHLVGLSHDGSTGGGAYFSGFTAFQWVPVMGSHASGLRYAQCALQWSKGEYANANQTQDDFNVITVTRKFLSFRAKTHVGVQPLKLTGTRVDPLLNRGQIVTNTDVDVFSFAVTGGAGHATLKVDRTERTYGLMLDIDASIIDGTGKTVVQSNKPVNRGAEFNVNLPAGNYTLAVKGGAEGTPATGFSNYSSRGFYAIEGEIAGGVVKVAPAAADRSIRIYPAAGGSRVGLDIPLSAHLGKITLAAGNGRIVFDSRRPVNTIDLTGMSAGPYLLSIAADGGTVARTIIKK